MSITEVFGGMSTYRHSSITTTLLQHLALSSFSECIGIFWKLETDVYFLFFLPKNLELAKRSCHTLYAVS